MGWDVVVAVAATLVATAVVPPWVEAVKGRRRRIDAAKDARMTAARALLTALAAEDRENWELAAAEIILLSTSDETAFRGTVLSSSGLAPAMVAEALAAWAAADIRTPRRAMRSARKRQARARN